MKKVRPHPRNCGVVILKTKQMFSVLATQERFVFDLDLSLRKIRQKTTNT